jgi:hypothetical protein
MSSSPQAEPDVTDPGPPPREHVITWSSLTAIVVGVLLLMALGATGLDDPAAHLLSHLAFGLPALALLVVALKTWPPPFDDRYGRPARRTLLVGLAVTTLGQIVEGTGAFGFDGNKRINALATAHDVGIVIGTLGLLVLMLGIGLSVVIAIARRIGIVESRWILVLVGIAVAAVVLFIVGGFIFGY